MSIVNEVEALRVQSAITDAERATSGEIVAMITARSSSYAHVSILWAALAALAVPLPLIYWTWWPIQYIYLLQLVVFATLALLLSWQPVRLRLVPAGMKKARAHRRAVEQFLAQNLHTTAGRTGVLIFVSVAERYVEILADTGIRERVPPSEWQGIVDNLTEAIRMGHAADGFVNAIGRIGQHLATHFPPGTVDPNELPNHLIVLTTD